MRPHLALVREGARERAQKVPATGSIATSRDAARRVLEELAERGEAKLAFWVRPDEAGRPAAWGAVGADVSDAMIALAEGGGLDGALGEARRATWSLGKPCATWSRRFVLRKELVADRSRFRRSRLYRLWRAHGLCDITRLLVYERGALLALVALVRRDGEPAFARADVRRLQPLVAGAKHAFALAAQAELDGHPEERGELVLDPRGQVMFASDAARAWLAVVDCGEAIARLAAHLVRKTPREGSFTIHGLRFRWVRMDGREGPGTIVTVDGAPLLSVAPDALLSPLQQVIARRAAEGASAAAIAAALARGKESVRSHMKQIYRRLGASNRAQLAAILTREPSHGNHAEGRPWTFD